MNSAEHQRAPRPQRLMGRLLGSVLVATLMPVVSASAQTTSNPIVLENQQPGSGGLGLVEAWRRCDRTDQGVRHRRPA